MRVIGGSCRGRTLVKFESRHIRPTSDRAREAIFNILGPKIKNARILDIFAGTGAMGIEALSRGACHATFIDFACDIIQQNIQLCHLKEKAMVISWDIVQGNIPKSLYGQSFDFIFIDPPYGKRYIENILEKEAFLNLLDENSIIIAEQSSKESLKVKKTDLDIFKQKKYSKTIISFMTKI